MPTQYAPIYDAVAQLGNAYVLPPEWTWLTMAPDCLLLGDAAAALARLTQQFPPGDLLASGVARQAEGDLVINPVLTAEDPGFIVLRKNDGTAFDIMTARRCVSGTPPVLKALHDRVVARGIAVSPSHLLYATFSMVDTVLLRSLGVAVATAAHLQSLHLRHLQRLLMLVGGSAHGDVPKQEVELSTDEEEDRPTGHMGQPSDRPAKFVLAIVAGSISVMTADIPAALQATARHLWPTRNATWGFPGRGFRCGIRPPRNSITYGIGGVFDRQTPCAGSWSCTRAKARCTPSSDRARRCCRRRPWERPI